MGSKYGLKYDLHYATLSKLSTEAVRKVAEGQRYTKLERLAAKDVLKSRDVY